MIPVDVAVTQSEVLLQAAVGSPLRQVRSELARRAEEWTRALDLLDEAGEDYEIELAGAVAPGDRVVAMVQTSWDEKQRDCIPVLRVLHRDGQTSLHLAANSNGRETYINYAGPSSPVVVRR